MTDLEASKGRFPDPERLDGFPSLSHFIAEDTEGAIFLKFDRLSARNLLYLQSNLNELQARLGELDRIDAERGVHDSGVQLSAKAYSDLKAKARWYQEDRDAAMRKDDRTSAADDENATGADAFERVALHRQIKEAMRDYREALIQAREVMNFSPPSTRALSTLKRYFYTEKDKSALLGCDANLLDDPEDLIALVQSDNDRLSGLLRHTFGRCFSDRKRNPQPDLEIYFFSENRIQLASYIISIFFSGILLLGAMACLSILNNRSWKLRLGIVALFTSLFGVVIGLLTNARRAEVFASTAAYTAVLVVYVSSNLGPSAPGMNGV
ncbi:hypothetical protein L207DRAFT_521400 [Hyaloscypha variabilis F]|uniref:DUF6594 domain-containing protein n=1 Tax=Hyaloscypha variabilis (strain UAMH 11265 / GT02V1 / F) TaxID=1149755 RepID=A0A2J6QR65_HYAVF|nr:hypothetical protein L207DRAFT_521400 [Hyaloscypha variabilis F]